MLLLLFFFTLFTVDFIPRYFYSFFVFLNFQVSWIRKRDLHILTAGVLTYTSDERFQVRNQQIKNTIFVFYFPTKHFWISCAWISNISGWKHYQHIFFFGFSTIEICKIDFARKNLKNLKNVLSKHCSVFFFAKKETFFIL